MREWTFTFASEFPFWELESWWTLEFLKSDCRGQNPMDWGFHYIIEKIFKRKCPKWTRMTHLDTSNTSYGQKKGRESNWQFDFQPLKVKNCPDLLTCRWRATYCWKALDKGYNFALDLVSIVSLHTKLSAPKIVGIPTLGISRVPFWSHGTKCHLGAGLVAKYKVYYKGEGGGFPQVQVVLSLMSMCLPVAN